MNLLNWITQSVRRAVLQGFEQAAQDLELAHVPGVEPLASLEGRLNTALAPPETPAAGNGTPARRQRS